MDDHWLTARANCFIEFKVRDAQRFRIFLKLFAVLQAELHKRGHWVSSVDASSSLTVRFVLPEIASEAQSGQQYNTQDWLAVFDLSDLANLGLANRTDSAARVETFWLNGCEQRLTGKK